MNNYNFNNGRNGNNYNNNNNNRWNDRQERNQNNRGYNSGPNSPQNGGNSWNQNMRPNYPNNDESWFGSNQMYGDFRGPPQYGGYLPNYGDFRGPPQYGGYPPFNYGGFQGPNNQEDYYQFRQNNGPPMGYGPRYWNDSRQYSGPHPNAQHSSQDARSGNGPPMNQDGGRQPQQNNKRTRDNTNDDSEPAAKKYGNLPKKETTCGNCQTIGHRVVHCIGPVAIVGFIMGCGFCNGGNHISEECELYDVTNSEDRDRLAIMCLEDRENLPPLACTVNPLKHRLAGPGQKYEDRGPWTTDTAIEYQMAHPTYWQNHTYKEGNNQKESLSAEQDYRWAMEAENEGDVSDLAYPNFCAAIRPIKFSAAWKPAAVTQSNQGERGRRDDPGNNGRRDRSRGRSQSRGISRSRGRSKSRNRGNERSRSPRKLVRTIDTDTALSVAAPPTLVCTNCEDSTHDESECAAACGCCGEAGHQLDACPRIQLKCVCKPAPGHLILDCKLPCNAYLCIENKGESDHYLFNCSNKCCVCGAFGHDGKSCLEARNGCKVCRSHDHITAMHTGDGNALHCTLRACPMFACEKHCQKCGFENHNTNKCTNKVSGNVVTCAGKHSSNLGVATHCAECESNREANRARLLKKKL